MLNRKGLALSQQWLLIALVILVPMLSLVAYASWSFYQQMHIQRVLVDRADRLSDLQAGLDARLRDLERMARQYRLVRDPDYLQAFWDQRQSVYQNLNLLRAFLRGEQDRETVLVAESQHQRLQSGLNAVEGVLDNVDSLAVGVLPDEAFSASIAALTQQRRNADAVMTDYVQALSARGEQVLQRILWRLSVLGLISLPVTLTLMGLGVWQMVRPIRRLSGAIRELGHGDWDTPIAVSGPRDFRALGERLEWMREQLREAEYQKQNFIRHVSHELKTPLSAIVEAGSLLQDEVPGPVNQRQCAVLDILQENTRNLQELIQQLLNYNVITHNVALACQSVALEPLCQSIAKRLSQQNLRHRVEWDWHGEPEQLETDPHLLEMIVSNLMSNAYHYSPDGAQVRVQWGQDQHETWVSVSDQGPGIEPEDRERIFLPFVQGQMRRHGAVQGSGVGLAIVRESARRLGGDVEVSSEPGVGSCFRLRFPNPKESVGELLRLGEGDI